MLMLGGKNTLRNTRLLPYNMDENYNYKYKHVLYIDDCLYAQSVLRLTKVKQMRTGQPAVKPG
jgi:hypothetical protein